MSLILFFHPLIDQFHPSIDRIVYSVCMCVCFSICFVFSFFRIKLSPCNLTNSGDIVASFYGGIQTVFAFAFVFISPFDNCDYTIKWD